MYLIAKNSSLSDPLIFLLNTYDMGNIYTLPMGIVGMGRTKTFPQATVTIRFSKACHVRREPDEVRQQVEDM